ncbi:hypothetical protein [Alishewanella phage vB_AspM_Slickus01]|nr:hypothetical protein [Alishewanella phage vB_AspM_Slickus01]
MTDYTKYEYQDSVDRMTEKLSQADGWGDGYDSSMGQVLIQLTADTTDHLHYMLERRTAESYLFTARTRSAVIAKASERGYHYLRSLGNRGTLSMTITTVAAANIIIPKFSTFLLNDIAYVSTEEVFIATGETSVNIPVVQGLLIEQTISQLDLDDSGNYIIETDYDQIDNNAIDLNADGFDLLPVWRTTRRAMSFLTPTENFYDVRYGFDGMRFIFGNDKFGRKPVGEINLRYVRVESIDEPLNNLGNDFEYSEEIVDVSNNTYEASIINITRIHQGSEAESIDSIKVNAVLEHNSSGRAVTDEDSIYWILNSNIGNIVDVKVTGENEINSFVYNTNNVYINYVNDTNSEMTGDHKQELRDFLKTLSIANPHYVIQKVEQLFLAVGLSVKKDKLLDISDADYYQIIKQFLEGYFAIQKGSIGARYEQSDLIRDLYQLEIIRNNISYKLVDYLRLDIDLLFPFTVPFRSKEIVVKLLSETPKVDGTSFSLRLDGVLSTVPVYSTDNNLDILFRMRDHVFATTPYLAEVVIGDIGGEYQEEFISTIGNGMMFGTNVPMNSPEYMMGNFLIGNNQATVLIDSPAYNITHTYAVGYENTAGRRPIIPLAIGTTVNFTAPSDTNVLVYVRTNLNVPATESLFFTVTAGNTFSETFDSYHSIQLSYVNTSAEQMQISFNYPLVDSALNTGLRIYTRDGYGDFSSDKEGDIADFTVILRNRKMPVIQNNGGNVILSESMSIVDQNNNTLYRATRAGTLLSTVNVASIDGRVNYLTGVITIPSELSNGEYFVKFKQDKYQNVHLNENTIGIMTNISDSISNQNPFSFIEVVK